MACEITFDKQGNKIGVEKNNKLFQQILSNPFIKTFDDGIKVFQQIYNEKEGLNLVYKVDDNSYQSYSLAAKNSQNKEIKATVETSNGFKELFSVPADVNISSEDGYLNNLIKTGILSGESYLDADGTKHYKAEGKTSQAQKINIEITKDLLQKQFGLHAVNIHKDNSISIVESEKRENVVINGKIVKLADLKNKTFQELKNEFGLENAANILANEEFKQVTTNTKPTNIEIEILPENELQERIKNLLKKFGIKTLSFDTYLKNYNKRNVNIPLTAKGLADVAEKIIALKDGIVEEATLLEETAHLIEASIPQEDKENILRNIHKTKEWGQFAEHYSQIYATEQEVRTEILGKIIANSIKEQFEARNQNDIEDSIINKIKELVSQFLDRIKAYFKPEFQQELDTLNKNIYDSLMSEKLDLSSMKGKGILYNTSQAAPSATRLFEKAQSILERLQEQSKVLSKKYSTTSDRLRLETAKDLIEAGNISGVVTLVRLASSQVAILKKSASEKREGDYPISPEENMAYQHLRDKVIPSLAEVKILLKDIESPLVKEIEEEIKKVTLAFSDVSGLVNINRKSSALKMVENIIERHQMSVSEAEEFRGIVEKAINGAMVDTDFFHAHLGSLLTARNPLLNMAGNIIERVNIKKNDYFQNSFKKLTNLTETMSQKEWEQLFDENGYILNERDSILVEKELEAQKVRIINQYNSLVNENAPKVTESKTFLEENKDNKSFKIFYNKELKDYNRNNVNSYFKDEYIKQLKKASVEVNGEIIEYSEVYPDALDMDAQFKAETSQIRFNSKNGLTEADRAEIQSINNLRQEASNPRSPIDGTLLPGIEEIYDENLGRYVFVLERSASKFSQLTEEERQTARTVVGLNQITLIKQKFYENKGKEINQKFLDEVRGLKTVEEKLNFIKNNAYISFPDSFYDNFKKNTGIVTRLREVGSKKAEDLISQIRAQQSIKNNIMRISAVYNNPGETNFVEMNKVHKDEIRNAESRLEELYKQAKSELGKDNKVSDEELGYDNVVNEAYNNYLIDLGANIEDGDSETTIAEKRALELTLILENVTPKNYGRILDAKRIADEETDRIPKSLEKYFNENMTLEEKQAALIEFGKSRLLPYLKKTEPIGYSKAMEDVRNGAMPVEDFIQRKDLVKVSPNISYYETEDENVNPDWIYNRDNKKEQWTKEYLFNKTNGVANKKFYDMFDLDENGNRKSNKNEKLWNARQALLEYSDQMIEYQGLTGKRSRYLKPQVRATEIDRLRRLTPSLVKQSFLDLTQYRPEEQEKGTKTSDGLYTIPTYYNTPLEDKNDVTKDYLYAYALWGAKASEYKARREHIGDMFIIEDVLNDTKTTNKKSDSANTLKMFKNFMEYNFYGVRENFSMDANVLGRKVDVGKVLISLNKFAKKTNVANLTTALTSLGQSSVQKLMETVIGQKIDKESSHEGNKLFVKYAPEAAKESMGFKSNAVLNVIGEALGIYNAVHRYEDSQFSKAGRAAINLSSKLHELGNFGVIPRTFLSVIASYRYVDGKITAYNKFKQQKQGEGFTGDIDLEWSKYELFAPDFISAVKNGVLDFKNPEFLDKVGKKLNMQGEELEKYLDDKKTDISIRALDLIKSVDSQIPSHQRAVAQRDARANFFLSHLSWLLVAKEAKFSSRHYSYANESFMEGSWRTTYNFLGQLITNPKGFKETYEQLDENQKKNLKRTIAELGFASALGLMAMILSNYNDDDKDPNYALALSDMFLSRVAVEQIGSTVGFPSSATNIVSNPIMVFSKFQQWAKINDLAGTPEQRNKYLNSIVPMYKDIERFSDPIATRKKYIYFQEEQKDLFDIYAPLTNLIDKE